MLPDTDWEVRKNLSAAGALTVHGHIHLFLVPSSRMFQAFTAVLAECSTGSQIAALALEDIILLDKA